MHIKALDLPTRKINQLKKADIHTLKDIMTYFPRKYYDFSTVTAVKDAQDNQIYAIKATIKVVKRGKGGLVYAIVEDDNKDSMLVSWFGQSWLYNKLSQETEYLFCGKVKVNNKGKSMTPIMYGTNFEDLAKIHSIYPKIKGMSDDYLNKIIDTALLVYKEDDYLQLSIRNKFKLLPINEAVKFRHRPTSQQELQGALRRFTFDDLFRFAFQLKNEQTQIEDLTQYATQSCEHMNAFYDSLPFEFTADQKEIVKNIYLTMREGELVNALIQGDVGCGKTIVALSLMLISAENNFQSALMAPTEILARQHYEEAIERTKHLPVKIAYLSGSLKTAERKKVIEGLKKGEIDIAIGTHALTSNDVEFNNLGLTITDEEHRFGVKRKEALRDKSKGNAHRINMSATPIPRTLISSLYGESIQVYNIKTKPKGRKPVKTRTYYNKRNILEFMRKEIEQGRQCYIVCPAREESEAETMEGVASVEKTYNGVRKYFEDSNIKVAYMHGQLDTDVALAAKKKFENKEAQILVATTIIETGINVPNASVIYIRSSDRFGLAQLHQLRGRVGRDNYQSYCILEPINRQDEKAQIMCKTNDGFQIAEEDLRIRGTGDLLGRDQSGRNKYIELMLDNEAFYHEIKELVDKIYANPKWYAKYKSINDLDLSQ